MAVDIKQTTEIAGIEGMGAIRGARHGKGKK